MLLQPKTMPMMIDNDNECSSEFAKDVCNSAAIREALEAINSIDTRRLKRLLYELVEADIFDGGQINKTISAVEKVRRALSAPARNCDRFNTGNPMKDAEDAYFEWQRYCDNPTIPPSCKIESAFKNWLFAKAAQLKGECDGR